MSFYSAVKTIASIILKPFYKIQVIGEAYIPSNGKLIICANHVSLMDPIILAIISPRQISFMAKKELFNSKLLKVLLSKLGAFPVNREGADLSAIKNSLKVLRKEHALGMFPEGTRVSDKNVENTKPGLAMIGIKSKAPIVPIYIDSSYKLFSKISVIVGKPIMFDEFFDSKLEADTYKKLSKEVMQEIYKLGDFSSVNNKED